MGIFWYDAQAKQWVEQPSVAHPERNEVVLATKRLGTFRLFAANRSLFLPLLGR
ncbi:MAG: hypothetical protein HY328_16660 [Chloroflexi bacterium]|nr:hypothetical protein [Chloroflexota bacterium]